MRHQVRWSFRLLWVLGTIGRMVVLGGMEGAAVVWANSDATRPDSSVGNAVAVGFLDLAAQCVVAGLWAVGEGVGGLPFRLVLRRWGLAVFVASFVAPVYNQIGSAPLDHGLLLSDSVQGAFILGVPVVGFAFGGWVLGEALGRRRADTSLSGMPDSRQ